MFMTGKRKEETSVFVRNKAKLGKAGVAGGRRAGEGAMVPNEAETQ